MAWSFELIIGLNLIVAWNSDWFDFCNNFYWLGVPTHSISWHFLSWLGVPTHLNSSLHQNRKAKVRAHWHCCSSLPKSSRIEHLAWATTIMRPTTKTLCTGHTTSIFSWDTTESCALAYKKSYSAAAGAVHAGASTCAHAGASTSAHARVSMANGYH